MATYPSGQQYEIRHGEQRAIIVEVGAGVRVYEVGGRAVLDPYPEDQMPDGAHGAVLVPWPNRLADGQYRFEGTDYQLALTEPTKHNAIHGLLRWRNWTVVEQETNRVRLAIRLHPMMGYPFCLDATVDYLLDDDGLTVTTTATNVGDEPCPYGAGQHPYLSPGEGLVDDAELRFAAETRIDTDDERQLPIGEEPVSGSRFDFSEGRRIGELEIDYAFTGLPRDADGRAWVRLRGSDGRSAEIWVDERYPYVELYTGDTLAPHRRRRGLGTEPMTCPPNAFASGRDVIRLDPGERVTSRWGARLR